MNHACVTQRLIRHLFWPSDADADVDMLPGAAVNNSKYDRSGPLFYVLQ